MSLTTVAHWTKRIGLLVVIGLTIAVVGVYVYLNWPEGQTGPSYNRATYACTNKKETFLQHKLTIPSLGISSASKPAFSIETNTGQIDKLPRIANLYKYDNPGESLNSLGEAKIIADSLGFAADSIVLDGTKAYKWSDPETYRTLEIEARNLLFTMKTDFTKSDALPQGADAILPEDSEAKQMAMNVLQATGGSLTKDLTELEPKVTLLKLNSDGSFSQAQAKNDADLIRVDFFKQAPIFTVKKADLSSEMLESLQDSFDYDDSYNEDSVTFKANVYTQFPKKSYVTVYVGPQDERKKDTSHRNIYQIDYKNWIIDYTSCGTYEIVSAAEAIQRMQNGEGSLVYLVKKNGDYVTPYTPLEVTNFSVLDISLGYYDIPEESQFLQPIYVIQGEATFKDYTSGFGQFMYYVPAVNYEKVTDKVEVPVATPEDGS